MKTEGQVRIPSGCAIAAVTSKEGIKMSGEMIARAMKPMHERSNGLGLSGNGKKIPICSFILILIHLQFFHGGRNTGKLYGCSVQ